MKTKSFDCVAMKRKASIRIYEQLKNLNLQEKIEYWQKRNVLFREEQENIKKDIHDLIK